MNKQEAERIGNEVASRYRVRPRDELLRYLKAQEVFEVVAPSGTRYQIEGLDVSVGSQNEPYGIV